LSWAKEEDAKVGAGVWIWWTDESRSDNGGEGAAAVWKPGNECRTQRSYLGTGHMEVFNDELLAIGLLLGEMNMKRKLLQRHGVKMVAILSGSQAAIRRTRHQETGPGQRSARRINRRVRALLTQ